MKEKANKIIVAILCIILIPILIINITIIVKGKINPDEIPDFFGYKPMVVVSGSMEPNLKIGDLVLVKEVQPSDLKVNDIITYRNDNTVITHRIIETKTIEGKLAFKTKGDNNNVADATYVNESLVEGKYLFKVALLGHFFMFISKPNGIMTALIGVLLVGIIAILISEKMDNKNDKKNSVNLNDEDYKEYLEYKKNKGNKKNEEKN